jgi:hypothetical protein
LVPKKKQNRILKEKGNISNLQKQVLKPNWSTKLFANSLCVSLCVCKSSDIGSSFYFLRIRFFLFLNLLFPFFSVSRFISVPYIVRNIKNNKKNYRSLFLCVSHLGFLLFVSIDFIYFIILKRLCFELHLRVNIPILF